MALSLRRLAGLSLAAASLACPKSVDAPKAVVQDVGSGVQIGQVVRLDASQSSDPQGRDLRFDWQFNAIPIGSTAALNDPHSATPSFLADVDGDYVVQVVVSNAFVSAAAVSKTVKVSKCGGRAPVFGNAAVSAKDAARPTITGNFAVGSTIVLSSDVSDPDNSTTDQVCTASQNQAVSYSWKLIGQPAASTASLNNPTASSPSFVADVAGPYTVRLVATDSTGRSSAPSDQTFTVGTCGANAPTIAGVAPVTEQLAVGKTIQMTASPDDADNGAACQAVLGAPQTFGFQWSLPQLPSGSRASLNSAAAQNPSFNPDVDGDYVVRLVVRDSTGRSSDAKDTLIRIPKCGNNAPVATITGAGGGGAPSTGFIGILVQFGETVTDPDGPVNGGAAPATPACNPVIAQTVSLKWSILALPAGSLAQLNNPTGTNPSFTPDVAGTYTVQLVATDQSGLSSAPVTQSVVVAACGMTPPAVASLTPTGIAVNAGTAVSVTAVATDPDNSTGTTGCNLPAAQTFTYAWSLSSKPAGSAAFVSSPSQNPATFTPDVANGTYQLQLVVTDSTGLKSPPAVISITTNSCGTNAPVLNPSTVAPAGNPDPGTLVTLTASGSDPDNTGGGKCAPDLATQQALSYRWTMTSRPAGSGAALSVSAADGRVATFTPDAVGDYQFSVVVTDSTGLSSAASFVTVTTSQCGAHAPQITAATATPPAAFPQPRPTLDAVALAGTVTDADDTCFGGTQPKTFSWTVSSRPAGSSAVISSPTSLTGASFTPDVPGAYQFRLEVTDSKGLQAPPAFTGVTASSCSLAPPTVDLIPPATTPQFAQTILPAPVVNVPVNNNCLPASSSSSYLWSIAQKPAGSSATLSNPTLSSPSFTPDVVGDYQFAVTVTNGVGISAASVFFNLHADACSLASPNNALTWASSAAVTNVLDPEGAAGPGPNPNTGAQVTVGAIASDPNDASCGAAHTAPIDYHWVIVASPAGSKATLTSASGSSTTFVPDVPGGTWKLSVVATDALGNASVAPSFVTVTASSCGANLPTVTIAPADLSATSVPNGGIFSMTPQTLTAVPFDADTSCPARFQNVSYTYAWSIASQPANGRATLSSTTGASTSFEGMVAGDYSMHVVVTASTGASSDPNLASSFVPIHVKSCGSNAPVVSSISTFASGTSNPLSRPNVGQGVDLVANATDADTTPACGPVPGAAVTSYTWTAVSLPPGSTAPSMFSTSTSIFTLAPDIAGTFTYSVVAADNTGLQSAPVEVSISTAACGPEVAGIRAANAGGFLTANSANAVSGVLGNALTFDLPPTVTHTGTGTGTVTVTGTPAGAFDVVVRIGTISTYDLSVDGGATFAPSASIAPSSPAGATGTTLAFSGSFVPGDTYVYSTRTGGFLPNDACVRSPSYAYSWSLNRPVSSQATLSTLSGLSPTFTPDVTGTYEVRLVVTDNAGLSSAPATLTVNAASCGNLPPTIAALQEASGPNSGALVPGAQPNAGDMVQLSAVGVADPNTSCGSFATTPFLYSWSLISKPQGSSATLSSPTSPSPTFIADLPNGTWQVALTVTDQLGLTSSPAFLTVRSTACGAQPPVVALVPGFSVADFVASQDLAVNGGVPLHLAHGSNPVNNQATLGGAPTTLPPFYPFLPVQLTAVVDPKADACAPSKTVTYQWSIAAQPAGSTAQINNAGAASPSFTPDVPGVYDFRLVLSDQYGNTSINTLAFDTAAGHPGVVGTCGTAAPVAVASVIGPIPPPAAPATANEPVAIRTQFDAGASGAAPVTTAPYPTGCGLSPAISFNWTLVAAPAGAVPVLTGNTLRDPTLTPDLPGIYTLDLAVSDGRSVSHAQVSENAVGGYTSAPAAASASYSATAIDGSGNPVVVWLDGVTNVLNAARCTSGCGGPNPVWAALPAIDTNVIVGAPTATDEPRPIAVASSGGNIYVAYYTGSSATGTGHTWAPCETILTYFNGSNWLPVGGALVGRFIGEQGTGCDASFTTGSAIGRYLALQINPATGNLDVAFSAEAISTSPSPAIIPVNSATVRLTECTPDLVTCTSNQSLVAVAAPAKLGRWVSIKAEPSGAFDAAFYVGDDGTGAKGTQFARCTLGACFTTPTNWSITNVDFAAGVDQGQYTSVEVIPAGSAANPGAVSIPVVAYRDETNRMAKFARCANGCTLPTDWSTAFVSDPASNDFGRSTQLAIDPTTGFPRLSYADVQHAKIRVFANNGGASFSKLVELDTVSPFDGLSMVFGGGTRLSFNGPSGLRFFAGP